MSDRTVFLRSLRGTSSPIQGDDADAGVLLSIEHHDGAYAEGLQRLLEHLPDDAIVLDIGANIGVVSVLVAELAPRGRVFAFEPAADNLRHLRHNVTAWPGIEVVPIAVADEDTTLRFDVNDAYPAGAHLAVDGAVEVPCRALDSWAAEVDLRRVDVVKIDVEGAEPLVLAGATETLRRHRPIVIAECNAGALRRVSDSDPRALRRRLAEVVPHVGVLQRDGSVLPVVDDEDLELCLAFDGVVDLVGTWSAPGARSRLRGRRRLSQLRKQAGAAHPPDPHNFVISGSIALEVDGTDRVVTPGEMLRLPVEIRNGTRWWLSPDFVYHPIVVGARWGGTVEAGRAALEEPIAPGARGRTELQVPAPDGQGLHRLQVTLVQEHFAWLADLDPRWQTVVDVQVGGPATG